MQRVVFHSTCAYQFTGVLLRTSQKPAPKLPKISEDFLKILRSHKLSEKHFLTVSEVLRKFSKISEHSRRFSESLKNHSGLFEAFPKFSKICGEF